MAYHNKNYEIVNTLIFEQYNNDLLFDKLPQLLLNNEQLEILNNETLFNVSNFNICSNDILKIKIFSNGQEYIIKSDKLIVNYGITKLKFMKNNDKFYICNV